MSHGGSAMRRREFITLFSGAAAWPFAARAQQPERMRRIGFIVSLTKDNPEAQARLAAFAQALRELGWTEGRNIKIDDRYTGGDAERTRTCTGRHHSRQHFDRGSLAAREPCSTDRVRRCR